MARDDEHVVMSGPRVGERAIYARGCEHKDPTPGSEMCVWGPQWVGLRLFPALSAGGSA